MFLKFIKIKNIGIQFFNRIKFFLNELIKNVNNKNTYCLTSVMWRQAITFTPCHVLSGDPLRHTQRGWFPPLNAATALEDSQNDPRTDRAALSLSQEMNWPKLRMRTSKAGVEVVWTAGRRDCTRPITLSRSRHIPGQGRAFGGSSNCPIQSHPT